VNDFALFASALSQEDLVPNPWGQGRLVRGWAQFHTQRACDSRALHMAMSPSVELELCRDSGRHTLYFYCVSGLKVSFVSIVVSPSTSLCGRERRPILQMSEEIRRYV